jgi:hypothetical protein
LVLKVGVLYSGSLVQSNLLLESFAGFIPFQSE